MICIDDTDGVWWEVEQLVGRHLGKMLFLIHPRYASATENRELSAKEAATCPIGGQSRLAPVIGFFRDQSGSLTILQTSTFSRFAYLLALRAFIRQRPAEMKVP